MIDFNIISTGSKGNAVVINNSILIDCGVPFRALAGVYKELQLVLLTHIHSDHFNRATIKRLAQERPTLRFGCCEWLVYSLLKSGVSSSKIDVYDYTGLRFGYSFGYVVPFPLIHDAPNTGYKIYCPNGNKILYATDTNSMDGVDAKAFDLYMIEANYGEDEIVERIRRKEEAGEYVHEWDVLQNHLSREKAEDWLYRNMGPDSRYVFLHGHE